MTIFDVLGDAALVLLAVAAIGAAFAVLAATVIVTAAVRAEERRQTLAGSAPGPATRLTRRLLAAPAGGTGRRPGLSTGRYAPRPARVMTATFTEVPTVPPRRSVPWPRRPGDSAVGAGPVRIGAAR